MNKKIILAISGSIAAYKAAYLVRAFIKKGAEVKVIMTPSACAFISPLTLSTLSKNKVFTDVINGEDWNNHVELGLWADLMLVAPATASTISKMAAGNADNILTAVYLSAKCPVFFAPAMDRDMWIHPSTQGNVEILQSYGDTMINVESGELASGLIGMGRMAEPETIVELIEQFFHSKDQLAGKKVMITAGPTYEPIDPVRFIGNRSSGKMGAALAMECAARGAEVFLILGPSSLQLKHPRIQTIRVGTAEEMYDQSKKLHHKMDICIFAAAVADYRPKEIQQEKIKKSEDHLELKLVKNKDIAFELGQLKSESQLHIGFALETSNEENFALDKMKRKNFDLIVLNSLNDKGAGFQHDTNKISIYEQSGKKTSFELKSKTKVASDIVNTMIKNYVKA